jgi:hypothetical protein
VTQDYAEAEKWLSQAAEQGLAPAQSLLRLMHAQGQGVTQVYAEACKWAGHCRDAYVKEATRKDIPVSEKNFEQVLTVCLEESRQGEALATFLVGLMHHNGHGVPSDYAKAAKWFRLALEGGIMASAGHLVDYYANGMGVPQDDKEALKWSLIGVFLKDYDENRRGTRPEYAEAVKWYRTAADSGSMGASLTLARMYAAGHGVSQDLVRSHLLFSLVMSKSERLMALDAVRSRDETEREMTSDQIADAKYRFNECAERNYMGCGF